MLIRFDDIILEPEQRDLLFFLVETSRSIPRDKRQKFLLLAGMDCHYLHHPHLANQETKVYKGDVEMLSRVGLVLITYGDRSLAFDVTPEGFRYYEYLKGKDPQPMQRVQDHSRGHLLGDQFQAHHPRSFKKWSQAEALLWGPESETQLTTIGLLCRESIQEFAAELVQEHKIANADPNNTHDVARIRSVIDHHKPALGGKTTLFLDALLAYWGTVTDLVQRQVHDSHREAETLVWEDARRVVTGTLNLFVEVDRALNLRKK